MIYGMNRCQQEVKSAKGLLWLLNQARNISCKLKKQGSMDQVTNFKPY